MFQIYNPPGDVAQSHSESEGGDGVDGLPPAGGDGADGPLAAGGDGVVDFPAAEGDGAGGLPPVDGALGGRGRGQRGRGRNGQGGRGGGRQQIQAGNKAKRQGQAFEVDGREFRNLNRGGVSLECQAHLGQDCWKDVSFGKHGELDRAECVRRLLLWEADVLDDDGNIIHRDEHVRRGGRLLSWYFMGRPMP